MARKTHTEAQARYDKANRRVYGFRLHNVIDADIIAKLASVDSMQGYIKQLIRDDIARTCSVPDVAHWIKKSGDALYCSKCNMPSINRQRYCCGCGSKMSDEVIQCAMSVPKNSSPVPKTESEEG